MSEFAFVKWASTVQLIGRRETREMQRLILHYVVSQGRRSGSSFWCQTPELKEWSKIMGIHTKRIVRARQQLSQDGILLPVSGHTRARKRRLTLHPDIVRKILDGSLPTVPVKRKTSQDSAQSNGMGSERTPAPERQDVTEESDERSEWEIRAVQQYGYYGTGVYQKRKHAPGLESDKGWERITQSEYFKLQRERIIRRTESGNPPILAKFRESGSRCLAFRPEKASLALIRREGCSGMGAIPGGMFLCGSNR